MLGANEAADFFLALSTRDQGDLLDELGPERSRPWIRLPAPDDAADILQALRPSSGRVTWICSTRPRAAR